MLITYIHSICCKDIKNALRDSKRLKQILRDLKRCQKILKD